MDIKKDEYFLDYIESRNLRDTTIRVQGISMTQYCNLIGKTPTELIEEAKEDQKNIPWAKERRIKRYLVKFLHFMKEKKLSPSTIETRMGHIRSFYIEEEIQLPKVRLNNDRKNREQVTHTDIPTRDDIAYALQFCSIKLRAIIMLMASSGMAHVDVRHLTIEDLYRSLNLEFKLPVDIPMLESFIKENKDYCPIFRKKRIKTDAPFTTFCTPETLKAIVDYIRNRSKPYESKDDTLFGYENQQGGNSLENMIRRVNDKANFGWQGTSRFFTAHKMRKFFTTTLYANRIPELTIRWYLGHKVDKTTDAYFKTNIKTHLKEYERLIPDLTFTKKIEILETDARTLQKMAEEITDLKARMEEQDRQLAEKDKLWALDRKKELIEIDKSKRKQ